VKLAAKHYWLFARVELGLSKAEFNAMTPAEWRIAIKLWVEHEKRIRGKARAFL
jgi:hypothetical protein